MTSCGGRDELRQALGRSRGLLRAVGLFSFFANLLMLAGPLYMLQVYDRVLSSRSEATLVALTLLLAFLCAVMALLDHARRRLMARIAARFQVALDRRVFAAALRRGDGAGPGPGELQLLQRAIESPLMTVAFDLPWTPLFLVAIALFHPWLGVLGLLSGGILIALALLGHRVLREPAAHVSIATQRAERDAGEIAAEAETIRALGMGPARRGGGWGWRGLALGVWRGACYGGGVFAAATRALRLFLQSAMLGLGAWLVLRGEVTGGVMVAASILLGRALAPVEMIAGQYPLLHGAVRAWHALAALLREEPAGRPGLTLPRPEARLEVSGLVVAPPGAAAPLVGPLSFRAEPGQVIGAIGAAGSGKTALAQAISGAWRPLEGAIRLGGAALDPVPVGGSGRLVGCMPQRVRLFEGTIAENIAGFDPGVKDGAVVAAADQAGVQEMILGLPAGYDTRLGAGGRGLSLGQMQRIALARAICGDPALVVLDAPDAHLDGEGLAGVVRAIRLACARGGAVLLMTHNRALIGECDLVLMLDAGRQKAFGPREALIPSPVVRRSAAVGA